MNNSTAFILILFTACSTSSDPPSSQPWPRCRAGKLTEKIEQACKEARTRAAVALYRLRPGSADDVAASGVVQALELGEWMRFCGQPEEARVLLVIAASFPPDIEGIRQALMQFARVEE